MREPKALGAMCASCPAQGGAMLASIPAAKPHAARLALVEDAPFYGKYEPARLLDRGLRSALDLEPGQTHKTLAVLCDCRDTDMPKARKCCAERLRRELQACGAPVVVPFGAYAIQSILDLPRKPRLLEWRGSVSKAKLGDRDLFVCPTILPKFAERVPQWLPWLEIDFERIGRVLDRGFTAPEDESSDRIVVAQTPEAVASLLGPLASEVAIDVETLGLGPTQTPLVCLAIADAQRSVVIPWTTDKAGAHSFWAEPKRVARIVSSALAPRSAVTHNGPAFDHIVLDRFGLHHTAWDDTLLAAHVIDGHMPKRLQHVATTYLDLPPWKAWDHAETIEDLWRYNGRDSLYTVRTWLRIKRRLRAEDLWDLYQIDKRAAELCTDMQVNGFRLDLERASEMQARLLARETELCAEAERILGRPLNMLSPKQLRTAFIGRDSVGGYVCFRSKSGHPVLNVDVMRAYATSANERLSGLALTVLDFRRVRKTRATNLQNPAKQVDARQRIHATWLNYGAVSGRFASQGPNLMNLPTTANDPTIVHGCGRPACGAKCKCDCDRCAGVRSLYCAEPGNILLAFDAKQLEMRIAAYASSDAAMIAACESSDLHTANADRVFGAQFNGGIRWQELTGKALKEFLEDPLRFKLRQLAKSGGFAVCYMAEAATVHARMVASGIEIELRVVERFLRLLREAFRGYYTWQERQLDEIARTGYVYETITGRRRWLGPKPKPTEAANFPIQAGAAGLMNTKLPAIVGELQRAHVPHRLIAQVHDSATFEIPLAAESDAKSIIQGIFEAPVTVGGNVASFPLDFKGGTRWA